jgi:hypothetical protein
VTVDGQKVLILTGFPNCEAILHRTKHLRNSEQQGTSTLVVTEETVSRRGTTKEDGLRGVERKNQDPSRILLQPKYTNPWYRPLAGCEDHLGAAGHP